RGLGGIASMIGLLLQVGLIVMVVAFAVRWFRRRQGNPAPAGMVRSSLSDNANPPGYGSAPGVGSGPGMGGGPAMGAAPRGAPQPTVGKVDIGPGDFQSFEIALNDVQAAYGRGDVAGLRNLATPEMAGYFADELRGNESRGVVNRISNVKLLQGDLSESWSEGRMEYATVAMR
ncbi:TIM44-like domain-containing protein, partial [Methylobacterium platani]